MKPFTTIEDQIEILKSRNLKFLDEVSAKKSLTFFGYYEIVNGYKDYLLDQNNKEIFKDDATFEHLFALYNMDKDLQSAVLDATLDFELMFKAAMSYVIGEEFTSDQNSYLKKENYKTGKIHSRNDGSKYYDIDSTFVKFDKILNDNKEPFKHYRDVHGNTPPWILFKGATLGNMMHFFKLQRGNIKDNIISIMFGIPVEVIKADKDNIIKNLFSDLLFLVFSFRNRAAHSGRIYNYQPEVTKIRYNEILHNRMNVNESLYRKGFGNNDLFTLFCGLTFLQNKKVALKLAVSLQLILNRHVELYKEDKPNLLKCIGYYDFTTDDSFENIFYEISIGK
ncbi:Abi family protein [uncultured Peptoniphilus sp.]|uniref:Abi family protein n=1 Tax=uncultured Peptoniphilus sp. TaxID=254354 RepID=UPI002803D025|nr:Abi family protein [uncultured Peptoniphilus sp.]